jgi:hypothetical protein
MITVTSTLVKNQHVKKMVADGWDNKGSVPWAPGHTMMRKPGKHTLINGLSDRVYKQIEREMVIEYRFQVVK